MKLKFKALKLWQGILLAVGLVVLAVGGALLYVHFTTGIGPKTVYPQDVSFVTGEDNDGYNETSGQFEKIDDFYLTLSTATEEVTEESLTLSFTKNFTETADSDGYITDGVIKVPQEVKIGEAFKVEVVKEGKDFVAADGTKYDFLSDEEKWNVGGVSNIFAKTSNLLILPTSAKVAIDVPVYKTEIELFDTTSNREIKAEKNGEFHITENKNVGARVKFLPASSEYIYGNEENKKSVFFDVIEGKENLEMHRTADGVYFCAVGRLNSEAKIESYVFKSAEEENKFRVAHQDETEDQFYTSAIQELARQDAPSKKSTITARIIQANISVFKVTNKNKISATTNKLLRLSAGNSGTANLNVSILNNLSEPEMGMIKNIAIRALKFNGETWVETDEVLIVNKEGKVSQPIEIDSEKYYFINSSVMDLSNAYWEISSKEEGEYKLEVVLLQHDLEKEQSGETVYKKFETEEKNEVLIEFSENPETSFSWSDPSDVEMVVYAGVGAASEYEKDFAELVSVPENNVYKKVVFFADFGALIEEEIKDIISFSKLVEVDVGGVVKTFAELETSRLLVKKGASFQVRYAVVKTDAYGDVILGTGEKYEITQLSNPINVRAVETVNVSGAKLEKGNAELVDNKYVLPAGVGSIQVVLSFETIKDAQLFNDQQDKFSLIACDFVSKDEYEGALNYSDPTVSEQTATYNVSFNSSFVSDTNDKRVVVKVVYQNKLPSADDLIAEFETSVDNRVGYLTVYKSEPKTIDASGLTKVGNDEVNYYQIEQTYSSGNNLCEPSLQAKRSNNSGIEGSTIKTVGDFNTALGEIKVLDKYKRETENEISLSTTNPNVIQINGKDIQIVTGCSGSAVLTISSGSATPVTINFIASTDQVTKIEHIIDDKEDKGVSDSDSQKGDKTTDLGSVSVEKLGYTANEITLKNLVAIYLGEKPTQVASSAYYFTIPTISTFSEENKKALFQEMLEVEFTNGGDPSNSSLTSSSRIIKLTIKHDFAVNTPITFQIGSDSLGINITMTLNITSNVTSVNKLESVNYGENKEASKSVERNNTKYIGVYAKFGINLNNYLQVTKTHVKDSNFPANLDWGTVYTTQVTVADRLKIGEGNGKITFNDVATYTQGQFTFYEVEGNSYAFNTTFYYNINPNFVITENNTTLNYLDIANGHTKALDSYFEVNRYVGSEALLTITYAISTTDQNFPATISGDPPQFARNGSSTLTLPYGQTSKDFKVVVSFNGNPAIDYKGDDLKFDMNLNLDIYDDLAAANSWIQDVVTYNGQKMLFVNYTANELALTTPGDQNNIDDPWNGYSLKVSQNTQSIGKISDTSFILVMSTSALASGTNVVLVLTLNASETQVASIRIPLLISTVGEFFSYYEDYNNTSTKDFDLATLLGDKAALENRKIYAELNAGSTHTLVYPVVVVDSTKALTVTEINSNTVEVSYTENGKTFVGEILKADLREDPVNTDNPVYLKEGKTASLSLNSPLIDGLYFDESMCSNVTLRVFENIDENGTALASIENNQLKLNNLVGNDQFIILEATAISKFGINYSYLFRIKVTADLSITTNYPYGGSVEYMNFEGETEIDLSDPENRFEIKGNNNNTPTPAIASSNSLTRAVVARNGYDIPYTIVKDGNTFEAAGVVRVTFSKKAGETDNLNLMKITLLTSDPIKLTITRTYKNVVGGSITYDFAINQTNFTYQMKYGATGETGFETIDDQQYLKINPITTGDKKNQEFTITTQRASGASGFSDVNTSEIETTVQFAGWDTSNYTAATKNNEDVTTFTLSDKVDPSNEIATIAFNYKDKKLTVTVLKPIIDEHKITLTFGIIYRDIDPISGDTVVKETQSNIGQLIVHLKRTVEIAENSEDVYGGMTYDIGDLISTVKEFKGKPESNPTTYSYQELTQGGYSAEITEIKTQNQAGEWAKDCNFINPTSTETTPTTSFIVAMLNEDKVARFTVKITVGGSDYTFYITKTFKKSVEFKDSLTYESSYYAGTSAKISISDYSNIGNLPKGNLEIVNGEAITPQGPDYFTKKVTVNGLAVKLKIESTTGEITFKTDFVSDDTTIVLPLKIKYSFGSGSNVYSFEFAFNVNLTILKNVSVQPNYPNPTGSQELNYESVSAKTGEWSTDDIKDFLVKGQHPLAADKRVVFTQAAGSNNQIEFISIGTGQANQALISDVKVKISAINSLTVAQCDSTPAVKTVGDEISGKITLTLVSGASNGTITFAVTYSGVSQLYTLWVTTSEVYQVETNMPKTVQDDSKTEIIYPDNFKDSTIFANDRIIKIDTSSFTSSDVGKRYQIVYAHETVPNEKVTIEFVFDTLTSEIKLDAGQSLSGYKFSQIGYYPNSQAEQPIVLSYTYYAPLISTTSRITAHYLTQNGWVEIKKDKLTNSYIGDEQITLNSSNLLTIKSIEAETITVSYTTGTGADTKTYVATASKEKFESLSGKVVGDSINLKSGETLSLSLSLSNYSIDDLTNTDTPYSVSYSIVAGGEDLISNKTYSFKLDLDIEVENSLESHASNHITIKASDFSSERNLIALAGIRKATTKTPITQDMFKGDNAVSSSLRIYDNLNWETANDTNDQWFKKFVEAKHAKESVNSTLEKMNGGTRFLTYTEVKTEENTGAAWDYLLVGEGASNNGDYVMLIYTYKSSNGLTKTFHIMVRILPDYEVSVAGVVFTSETFDTSGELISSTSDNKNKPYVVNWIVTDPSTDPEIGKYELVVTSNDSDKNPIVKIKKKNISSSDLAYNWTYTMTVDDSDDNVNVYNAVDDVKDLEYNNIDASNGFSITSSLTITQARANIFGTKRYRLVIENEFGYEAEFYFSFAPKNEQDPEVISGTINITEGDNFDIGATYENLTLTYLGESSSPCYQISSASTAPSNSSVNKLVNIRGIDAWGFDKEVEAANVPFNSPYITNFDNMTLQYVTIDKIEFFYNGQSVGNISEEKALTIENALTKVQIGEEDNIIEANTSVTLSDYNSTAKTYKVTSKTDATVVENVSENDLIIGTLATASGLRKYEGSNLVRDPAIYRDPSKNFTMPKLDSWIYSGAENANLTANTVNITMKITLKYSSSSNDSETYAVEQPLSVTRKLVVEKTGESTVADGEEFELADKFKVYADGKGASATALTLSASGYSILDDTLVISLPARAGATSSKVSYMVEVFDSFDPAKKLAQFENPVTLENTITRPQTFYRSISKDLKAVNTNGDLTGDGYMLNEGDKLTITFSDYGATYIQSGSAKYYGFYATYGGKDATQMYAGKNTTPFKKVADSEVSVDAINGDNITVKFIEQLQTNGTPDPSNIQVTYRVTLDISKLKDFKDSSSATETTDKPKVGGVANLSEETTFTEVTFENSTTTTTYNSLEAKAITQDKINLESSEFFSGASATTKTKSYIFNISNKNYRIEKQYIVTPALYKGSDNMNQVNIIEVSHREDDKSQYRVDLSEWAKDLGYYPGKGSNNPPERGTLKNIYLSDATKQTDLLKRIHFEIGNDDQTRGTANIDSNGLITTRNGYELGKNEYIHVYIYVKPAGVDGSFGDTADKKEDYYLLGSVRLIVKNETYAVSN